MRLRRFLPMAMAILFGFLTLVGLLSSLLLPDLDLRFSEVILGWAAFLAAVSLVLGVFNLFLVHVSRMIYGRNFYSLVLLLSMIAVFALAFLDFQQVNQVFQWVQAPLEAALASLMAIFLLMAGFRLLKRRPTWGALLFLLAAVLVLIEGAALPSILPAPVGNLFQQLNTTIHTLIVTSGVRGLLIGVALGTMTLSIRLLVGAERPYNK